MFPDVIRHKRGATFRHRIRWPDSLLDYAVRSQVLVAADTRETLSVRLILAEDYLPADAPSPGFGIIELSATAAQTSGWPIRLIAGDARAEIAGEVAYSQDFFIDMIREVTL